jgi:hypothetical protein
MDAWPVRLAFKAPTRVGHLHGHQLLFPHDVEIHFPVCVVGLARAVCQGPRTSQSRTCRARRRLVGGVAIRLRTGRISSEGLDKDLYAFSKTQLQVESALLLDVVISKGMAILKLLASRQKSSPSG